MPIEKWLDQIIFLHRYDFFENFNTKKFPRSRGNFYTENCNQLLSK